MNISVGSEPKPGPRRLLRTLASLAVVLLLAGFASWHVSRPDPDTRMCLDSIESAANLQHLVIENMRVAPAEAGKEMAIHFSFTDDKGDPHNGWWGCRFSRQPGQPTTITETFPIPSR
jgi:hypothetical protein